MVDHSMFGAAHNAPVTARRVADSLERREGLKNPMTIC
jgi:hypothetical protein